LFTVSKKTLVLVATAFVLVAVATNSASYSASQLKVNQPHTTTGRISGTVRDKYDARVVGATIKIQSEAAKWTKKYQWQGRSDDEGQFSAVLPAGTYQIYVRAPGFKNFESPFIKVRGKSKEMVNLHLNVAAVIDTIRIKGKR
jgi:hypothetical protein